MASRFSTFRRDNQRTLVDIPPLVSPVTYTDKILLLGSCFTEHIGNRLKYLKFNINQNPFGIVYNPLSIAAQLECLLNPADISRGDLVFHHDLWHSWMHHGRFSHPDADAMVRTINGQTRHATEFLKKAGLLVLTFGTPETFFLRDGDQLVSNCHQLPPDFFFSRKPDPHELAGVWVPLLKTLREANPGLRICMTISPVRYFKEGPTGNQVSKAILFLFIRRLLEEMPDLYYFPSYEIFMDDLRDYRYYDTDMMHPGTAGIEYVWNRFAGACINPVVYPLMNEVEAVVKSAGHHHSGFLTDTHRHFVEAQTARILKLQASNPFLDFSVELDTLQSQLTSDQS